MSEFGNDSSWCGGGQQAPTPSYVQAWMIAGACLPLLRVSLGTAPHSVVAADKPPALFRLGVDELSMCASLHSMQVNGSIGKSF